MRWTAVLPVIALPAFAACVTEPSNESKFESAVTATRTPLESHVDAVLRVNGGACSFDPDRDRKVCAVTTAVAPPRTLRIGDAIPSASKLNLCWEGAGCAGIPGVPDLDWCVGFVQCLPKAAACAGGFGCEPLPAGPPGIEILCVCDT